MNKTNYGAVANDYTAYKNNPNIAEWRLGHEQLLERLGPVIGRTIVDFGCGPATFGSLLSDRGAYLIGLDPDPVVIEKAEEVDRKGKYYVYTGLLEREVRDWWVDSIIATFSFCLIPDRELRYILRDMHRVLGKRNGRLLILEPNQEKAHGVEYANLHYHQKEGVQSGDYVHVTLGSGEGAIELHDDIYRTHADYRQLLEEAGFTIDQFEEPRPDPSWEGDWELEAKYPPFLLIVAH